MTKMCEVIQDSWSMLKTGGRGSSQTSEQLCRATKGSQTDRQTGVGV